MAARKRARLAIGVSKTATLDSLRLLPHAAPYLDSRSFCRLVTTCRDMAGDPWLVSIGEAESCPPNEGLLVDAGTQREVASRHRRRWRQHHFTGSPGSTDTLRAGLERVDWGCLQTLQLWLPTSDLTEPVNLLCQAFGQLPNLASFRLRGRAASLSDGTVSQLARTLHADRKMLPQLSTIGLHAAVLGGEKVINDLCNLALDRRQTLRRLELRESVLELDKWQHVAHSLRWSNLVLEVGNRNVHSFLLEHQQVLPVPATLTLEWYDKGMADYIEVVEHSDPSMQESALDALGAFAFKEGGASQPLVGRALAAIHRCLSWCEPSSNVQTRMAALTAVGRVAEEGNDEAARIIADSLEDPVLEVRLCAIDNLKVVAFPDDKNTIESICSRLPHPRDEVRLAARAALTGMLGKTKNLFLPALQMEKSLEEEVSAAFKVRAQGAYKLILESASKHMTHATAEEVLLEYADQDPRFALQVVASRLADPNPDMRRVASRLLQSLASKESLQQEAKREVRGLLQHPDPAVRVSSLDTLRTSQLEVSQVLEVLNSLCEMLKDVDARVRAAAVKTIVSIVRKTGARSLDIFVAVAECLQDEMEIVRGAAVEGLPSLMGRFDKYGFTITTLVNGISHQKAEVRAAHQAALAGCAKSGDAHAIARLTERLSSKWPDHVRMSAASSLALLAPPRSELDEGIVDSLVQLAFGDVSPQLHSSLVNTLATLGQGSSYVVPIVSAVAKKLEDRAARDRAIEALGTFPQARGKKSVIQAVSEHICSSSSAQAILKVASPGDAHAIQMLTQRLANESSKARWAVVQAFRLISTPEVLAEIVGSVSPHLSSGRPEVREAAVGVLAHIAPKGEPVVVHAVSCLLENRDEHIRHDGVKALKSLVEKNDHKSIALIIPRLKSPSSDVRKAATSAIKQLASKGDVHTILQLGSLLEHPESMVRKSAMVAMLSISEPGDPTATAVILKLLTHDLYEVRLLALNGLKTAVRPGDRDIEHHVGPLLQDGEVRVRQAARQVLDALGSAGVSGGVDVVARSVAARPATSSRSALAAASRGTRSSVSSAAASAPEIIDLS